MTLEHENLLSLGCAAIAAAAALSAIILLAGCCSVLPGPWCPPEPSRTPTATFTPTATPSPSLTPTSTVPATYAPTWTPTPRVSPTRTPRPLPTSAETGAAGYGWAVIRFDAPSAPDCETANRLNKHWIAVLCDASGRSGIGIYWRYVTVGPCEDCADHGLPFVPVIRIEAGTREGGGRPECVAEVPICSTAGFPLGAGAQRLLIAWDGPRAWCALLGANGDAVWTQELTSPVPLAISRIAPGPSANPVPEWGGALGVDVIIETGEALRPTRPQWCPPVPTVTPTVVPFGELGAVSGAVDLWIDVPAGYPISGEPRVIACLSSPSLASGVWLRVRDNGNYLQVKGFGCYGRDPNDWVDSGYSDGIPLVTGWYRCQWEPGRCLITAATGATLELAVPYPLVVGTVDVNPPWAADRPGTDSGLDVIIANRRAWRTAREGSCE